MTHRRRKRILQGHRPSEVLAEAVSVEFSSAWSGLCPVGLHGLDFEGQDCDACAESLLTEEQRRKLGTARALRTERAAWRAVWSTP